jgi:hypothetical protein
MTAAEGQAGARSKAQHQSDANASREDNRRLAQRVETAIAGQHGRHHVGNADIARHSLKISAAYMGVRGRRRIAQRGEPHRGIYQQATHRDAQ